MIKSFLGEKRLVLPLNQEDADPVLNRLLKKCREKYKCEDDQNFHKVPFFFVVEVLGARGLTQVWIEKWSFWRSGTKLEFLYSFAVRTNETQNKNNILKTKSIRRKVLMAAFLYLCAQNLTR